jgi:hypothetical protein
VSKTPLTNTNGGEALFGGGIATTDIRPAWENDALPDWVNYFLIPLLASGQSWPKASESGLWELRVAYMDMVRVLLSSVEPTGTAVKTISDGWTAPAKPEAFTRIAEHYDDKNGVLAKAAAAVQRAQQVDYFAGETQYSKISVNVAFWITVVAIGIGLAAAVANPLATAMVGLIARTGHVRIALILQRLAAAAGRPAAALTGGRVTTLAGAGAGSRLAGIALFAELVEEIGEELLIDALTQYKQIKMGTRDRWDWKKTGAAVVGAGGGALLGTKLGDPISRFAGRVPGIGALNRRAGDDPGFLNAVRRFPGRALSTGLNNMVTSPAASMLANGVVYGQWALPSAEQFYGGFAAGAARTGSIAPTNLSVLSAVTHPVTTLASVVSDALYTASESEGPARSPGSPSGRPPEGVFTPAPPSGTVPDIRDSGSTRRGTATGPVTAAPGDLTRTAAGRDPGDHGTDPRPRTAPAQTRSSDTEPQHPAGTTGEPATPTTGEPTGPRPADTAPTPETAPPQSTQPATTGAETGPGAPADRTPADPGTPTGPDPSDPSTPTGPAATAAPDLSDLGAATDPTPSNPGTATPSSPDTATTPPPYERTPAANDQPASDAPHGTTPERQTSTAVAPAAPPTVVPAVVGTSQDTTRSEQSPLVARWLQRGSQSSRDSQGSQEDYVLVAGRPIPGSRFVADGRPSEMDDLTPSEVRSLLEAELPAAVWGDGDTFTHSQHHFRVVVEPLADDRLGRTSVRNGTPEDPHLIRLAPRVAADQVARLVLHETSDVFQVMTGPDVSLFPLSAHPDGRDECHNARANEYRYLTAKRNQATTQEERNALDAEIRLLVDHVRGLEQPTANSIDMLLNRPADASQTSTDHTLVDSARRILGTDHSPGDLENVRELSRLLLGDAPPRMDALNDAVNTLLLRAPGSEVQNPLLQQLVKLAGELDVQVSPGADPVAAFREAIQQRISTGKGLFAIRASGITLPPADTGRPALAAEAPRPGDDHQQVRQFRLETRRKAREAAERRGTGTLDELQQFALQRALARIFAANPDDWMLKGGQSLLSRDPDGRASTDIDLVRMQGDPDPQAMADDYEAALALDFGDHLTFVKDSDVPILHGKARRMAHRVYQGDQEIMLLSVDLAPPRTRPVWKAPDSIPFPEHIVSTGHPDENPSVRVISYEDTLAHKVSGMYTHGIRTLQTRCLDCISRGKGLFSCKSGDLPYRCQDLVDVLMIVMRTSWDGPATHAMLHAEFQWRKEQGENLIVPEHFEIPNGEWFRKFDEYARSTPGLPFNSLSEALPLARAFLEPMLNPDPPPPGTWDPGLRRWVAADEAPATGTGDAVAPAGRPTVMRLDLPSSAVPSTVFASADHVARWDSMQDGGLDVWLADLKRDSGKSLAEKQEEIIGRLMYDNAYVELTDIPGAQNANLKHLRFYSHQRGELYSHAAALMADPETTVEIAFEPRRNLKGYQWDAHQSHLAHLGDLPEGVTLEQASAVVMRRMAKGQSVTGIDPATLADDIVEMAAQPFRDALALRRRLIEDYGIDPDRVRLAFANTSQKGHYANTQWMRAQLFALQAIQDDPVRARRRMVDSMLGPDATASADRLGRAQAVVDRLRAANDDSGEYALLWIRDTRGQPVGSRHGPHLDTRPEIVRQTIEMLRERHPGRRVVLLGDDLFAGRPELAERWRGEGVLDNVDTDTLVGFWNADENGGRALDYAEQGLVYHLMREQTDVVQLGMESGAMEIPAMLGLPTVYFEATEHDGNKGNRWQLYWQDWAYGRPEEVTDEEGNIVYDRTGRPVTTFQVSETGHAPLPAMRRMLYGPDLPDPDNRRAQPVAVYWSARVTTTVDRVDRLLASGAMDQWAARLGRSAPYGGAEWLPWSETDWERSGYYARQLRDWLLVDAATPEQAGEKWQAIRLALLGTLEPGFDEDQEYEGVSMAHPFTVLRRETLRQDDEFALRLAEAYDTGADERPRAVAEVLKDLLGSPEFDRRALADLLLFRLDRPEIDRLGDLVEEVTAEGR